MGVIVVALDTASLARTRFALSPAAELVAWLRLTASGRPHPVHGDPGPQARSALDDPDVALAAAVLPDGDVGYLPDLLTPKPPPGPPTHVLAGQLELVEATPHETVLAQVAGRRFGGGPIPRPIAAALDSGHFARRMAAGLATFWSAGLADGWPTLRAALDADLAWHARALAVHGIGSVLGSLHPSIRFTGSELHVAKPYDERTRFTGDELVVAPSLLRWPPVSSQLCDPANAVLGYPAVPSREEAAEPLAALLGATRATLLLDLDVARSTTELSARHGLSPATVSYHLGVLRRSELVTAARNRRFVLYQRNPRAESLLSTGADASELAER